MQDEDGQSEKHQRQGAQSNQSVEKNGYQMRESQSDKGQDGDGRSDAGQSDGGSSNEGHIDEEKRGNRQSKSAAAVDISDARYQFDYLVKHVTFSKRLTPQTLTIV